MFKKQHLALAIAATLAAGAAQAALETSVTLKNETAYMMKDGIRTGEATSMAGTGDGKGVYKFENTAKIFLNDELSNGSSWHGELNIVRDTKAINDYKGHETNTQRDWLRELYVDTTVGDWDLRLGKQQVVWGTADGIKLLDMINPTDWSEFNQNTMADARIPVWMVNAEKYLENGANIQLVLSQAEKNKIAGLNSSGDSGHPFVMKGVDTISGKVNGFYNIAPALGAVAATFNAMGGTFGTASGTLSEMGTLTVNGFAAGNGMGTGNGLAAYDAYTGAMELDAIAQGTNSYTTRLTDSSSSSSVFSWDQSNPNSTFEYMSNATFSTFNTFASISTKWVKDLPDNTDGNVAFRFKNTTDTGLNYSVNAAYRYSSNPDINLSWHDATTGAELTVQRVNPVSAVNGLPDINDNLSVADVHATTDYSTAYTSATNPVTILLHDGAALGSRTYYAAGDIFDNTGTAVTTETSNGRELRFTESMHRVSSLGGSFDFALDTEAAPVVIRGEFLYDKGDKQAVVDRQLLSIGDLTNALKMEDADYFKYVIGADTTVMTDMMVSGQFIQFRNLDYIDQSRTCTTQDGQALGDANGAGTTSYTTTDCSTYTGNLATLSLTNGMAKARQNQNFYSLFLSKPFGESGEGRWNNIFIYEAGGGKWNRFDVEYGFDDQLIGTFEVNKYFGDENTMFGQFENASNVQIGLKYLLQ